MEGSKDVYRPWFGHELSVKGIARRYAGLDGGISVISDVFGVPAIEGTQSLASKLKTMAREDFAFEVSDCGRHWDAGFTQTWTRIKVRIHLIPRTDRLEWTTDWYWLTLAWASGIDHFWNRKWACGRAGELPCQLTFEVEFAIGRHHENETGYHDSRHNVLVEEDSYRSMYGWTIHDPRSDVAHQFGHLIGLPDEYSDSDCADRDPVDTGSVMDNRGAHGLRPPNRWPLDDLVTPNIPKRLMTRFARNIGSHVVAR